MILLLSCPGVSTSSHSQHLPLPPPTPRVHPWACPPAVAGGTSLTTPQVRSELEYQVKRLSHHPSIAMWDGCNECGGGGDYMNFVMPVVAAVDQSRPIWPSCPAPGWVSGVDRLSARPNGKTLVTGPGGSSQVPGEGRPDGYPFPLESHGPYTAFMKLNMDDTVMPGHHVETGCEGEINHPTLVPANIGQGEEGWYRSEFGCVGWSSFESMSAEMPPDQWGMLTPGGRDRNWNPSNVISKFFGVGAADAMSESGEVAFQRQLYQVSVFFGFFGEGFFWVAHSNVEGRNTYTIISNDSPRIPSVYPHGTLALCPNCPNVYAPP